MNISPPGHRAYPLMRRRGTIIKHRNQMNIITKLLARYRERRDRKFRERIDRVYFHVDGNMEERITDEGKTLFFEPLDVARSMMACSHAMLEMSSKYFRKSVILFFLSILINILGWVSLIIWI